MRYAHLKILEFAMMNKTCQLCPLSVVDLLSGKWILC